MNDGPAIGQVYEEIDAALPSQRIRVVRLETSHALIEYENMTHTAWGGPARRWVPLAWFDVHRPMYKADR